MSVRLLVALALITFMIVPAHVPAHAQTAGTESVVEESNVVGTLVGVEGAVSLVVADAEPKPLALNDPVHMNDVIETGAGARAFVLLIDNTEITLGENAQLTIDEYVFDEESTAANKGRYSILRGAFLYTSGLVAKKENPDVTVNTPFGAIGIRGTTFWGGDIDDGYGILVTDGTVSVQTERGRINVDKGQGTSLRSRTSIPSRSAIWAQNKIDRAVQTIALKDANGVRTRVAQLAGNQKNARQKHKVFINNRQQRLKQEGGPHLPIRRIDNAPLPPLQRKSWVGDSVPKPEAVRPPSATPVDETLNKPFKPEPKAPGAQTEPLLKTAPTNRTPIMDNRREELKEKIKDKGAANRPRVDLPTMGENEAHTNELRERRDIQRREGAGRSRAARGL